MIARGASTLILLFSLSTLPVAPAVQAGSPISPSEFAHLMTRLSEPEGYFDTDNFISNERGYLKILSDLRRKGLHGGAYIGVGPDQNYSYIAEVRPEIAIIIDIRRQNALEHLYFKALFQLSRNRAQFLERLFGRRIDTRLFDSTDFPGLLEAIDKAPKDPSFQAEKEAEAIQAIKSWRLGLTRSDFDSIRSVATAFSRNGLDLKFSSYRRPPRPYYPTYRQLLLETDADGIHSNYLAAEERFLFIKKLHDENRIIPIVGDLGGETAIRNTAEELRRRGIPLKCIYVSNVEFYLFGSERWRKYVRNISSLPRRPDALLIRSYANPWWLPTHQISRDYMTTQLTSIAGFLDNESIGNDRDYWDLILHARRP